MRPMLERLSTWLVRQAGEAVAWVIAIAGVLLAADAAQALRLLPT